jgi:hypothetical protein
MPDLTRQQTRILFELSNGKRLVVSAERSEAFICGEEEIQDPRSGIAARYDDVRRLVETECLLKQGRRDLTNLGEVTAYGVSRQGAATLVETSFRIYEE